MDCGRLGGNRLCTEFLSGLDEVHLMCLRADRSFQVWEVELPLEPRELTSLRKNGPLSPYVAFYPQANPLRSTKRSLLG